MDSEEQIFLMLILGGMIYLTLFPYLSDLKQQTENIYTHTINYVKIFFEVVIFNPITLIIFNLLLLELMVYLSYKQIVKIRKRNKERNYKKVEDFEYLRTFLATSLKDLEYHSLLKIYKKFKGHNFSHESLKGQEEKVTLKLKKIKNLLIELEHRQELNRMKSYKEELNNELEKLEEELHQKKIKLESDTDRIAKKLKVGEKTVFRTSNLTLKEKEILKKKGYHAINEYCVFENKLIPVLVNPPLNHSPTHEFLVWSVKKLLKTFPEIEKIEEHETRDADLTFKIKDKRYALEVETGSLLKKKRQLHEKIKELKESYPNQWIILVSNKSLAKKYRPFGKVSTRKDIRKNIEKWIKESEIK